jgi:hypothetical protein
MQESLQGEDWGTLKAPFEYTRIYFTWLEVCAELKHTSLLQREQIMKQEIIKAMSNDSIFL